MFHLNEMGQFSWYTIEGEPIIVNGRRDIYMVLPDGTVYVEHNYEGYGIFGGKDYYIAIAEINDLAEDVEDQEEVRSIAIDATFDPVTAKTLLYPQFTSCKLDASDKEAIKLLFNFKFPPREDSLQGMDVPWRNNYDDDEDEDYWW